MKIQTDRIIRDGVNLVVYNSNKIMTAGEVSE